MVANVAAIDKLKNEAEGDLNGYPGYCRTRQHLAETGRHNTIAAAHKMSERHCGTDCGQ
jgi:hypothetical protein